ncbi:hypothetical protein HCN44_007657 [Aphidius gifuensis]|uniref:C2 domain-containing protein n=1 Tax=Aphidius gifuensis TaxID=684658 RepID=A0A834XKX9_APHGI|nr:C2 domain-containing protein 3-like [Aphidius gifuensis]KAF7988163.1 hypothetical protein HCN44_007657 [Aphidius gifuensis]
MSEKLCLMRSLPPLVEGRVHGYVDLMIDEIILNKNITQNNVIVMANWWGETDSAKFKPLDINNYHHYPKQTNILTTYSIKTNIDLFKEYLNNSEAIELVVLTEEHQQVLGTAQITGLLDIFLNKTFSQYLPIFDENTEKIGDVHVELTLDILHKDKKTKEHKLKAEIKDLAVSSEPDISRQLNFYNSKLKSSRNDYNTAVSLSLNNLQNNDDNIYRSILKEKRYNVNSSRSKFDADITDKLVAQVVARAKKLRGVLKQETNSYYDDDDDDVNHLDIMKINSSFETSIPAENEAVLYKYFTGEKMTKTNEQKALKTLRSYSPTQSLIELAAETVGNNKTNKNYTNEKQHRQTTDNYNQENNNDQRLNKKILNPIDYVDSLRIAVESFTLTSAGYRRVKSSCLSRGDQVPVSVTYFVQYNGSFGKKKTNKTSTSDKKLVKMTSKKQIDQTIYFNHEAVYDLQKNYLHMDMPLKFSIYNRHLNQRTPTELGIGSIYIGDASNSSSLSSTQRLAIIKKGIKVGELKVTVELGCDKIHFGKNFVEAVTSAKENIPVFDNSSSNSSSNNTPVLDKSNYKFKTLTGNNNTNNKSQHNTCSTTPTTTTSSVPSTATATTTTTDKNTKSSKKDKPIIKVGIKKNLEEKILLHGLIYIGEGVDIPSTSTYLVCRAFWREDRSSSQVCNDTTNPFYNFHQLVPLIYGQELLERTKDNCIITEVYSKNPTGEDHFIGIIKLSLHQLYLAFKDPLVLSHLLVSKYPVISVDGWVPINHPVTGKSCGKVSAIVALGTAEQIAFLEMIRGLRDSSVSGGGRRISDRQESNSKINKHCQTELSPAIDKNKNQMTKQNDDNNTGDKNSVLLNAIVNKLAQALTVPKTMSTNQQVQTSFNYSADKNIDDHCQQLNCVEENNDNHIDNFNIELHRSVGVGAEFIEPSNQPNSNDVSTIMSQVNGPIDEIKNNELSVIDENDGNQGINDFEIVENGLFRAVVEIDCALHLPQVELMGKSVDPCTYVAFKDIKSCSDDMKIIETQNLFTNICLFDCNPKYNWQSHVKLSNDLLISDEKKLVLKVCRLVDDKIDIDKDIVIGFATIDLSVLTSGFLMVSGWFHIIDFNGKCNGQIKISVRPLDNISTLKKNEINSIPACQSNLSSVNYNFTDKNYEKSTKENSEPVLNIGLGLGEASMSFLSLSLNQKLSELDEIKKRLQSRLEDVTSNAFEDNDDDDIFNIDENEFEILDQDCDHPEIDDAVLNNPSWLRQNTQQDSAVLTNQNTPSDNSPIFHNDVNPTDTGYSSTTSTTTTTTNIQSTTRSNLITNGNYNYYKQDQLPKENHSNGIVNSSKLNENTNGNNNHDENIKMTNQFEINNPIRGTKMHISHLLEQLSTQLTSSQSLPMTNPPMKRNIMDLLSSLRQQNNNYPNDMIKCNREANVRTIPTQTDDNNKQDTEIINNIVDDEIPAKTQKRDQIIVQDDASSALLINPNNHVYYSQCDAGDLTLDTLPNDNSPVDNYGNTVDAKYSETNSHEILEPNPSLSVQSGSLRVTPTGLSNTNIFVNNNNVTVIDNNNDGMIGNSESIESTNTITFDNTILQTDSEIDDNSSLNSSLTTSVSNVSRQAPDGGNPVEDPSKINTIPNYLSDNDSSTS